MVNKLKKVLRNEKGFTLVELLAVIAILAIIVAIAVPAIGNVIKGAEGEANTAQDELVFDAARYADIEGQFTSGTTTVWDLINDGFLEKTGDFKDITSTNTGGKIKFNEDTNTYEFVTTP